MAIVNVASTAGRVSRPNSGAYSASKFALIGWTDALHAEEREHGVHVGLVLPGFVKTEGFPATELLAKAATRLIVSEPDVVAEAIVEAGPGGRAERYVPRYYWIPAALRILAPSADPPGHRRRGVHDRHQGGRVGARLRPRRTRSGAGRAHEYPSTSGICDGQQMHAGAGGDARLGGEAGDRIDRRSPAVRRRRIALSRSPRSCRSSRSTRSVATVVQAVVVAHETPTSCHRTGVDGAVCTVQCVPLNRSIKPPAVDEPYHCPTAVQAVLALQDTS